MILKSVLQIGILINNLQQICAWLETTIIQIQSNVVNATLISTVEIRQHDVRFAHPELLPIRREQTVVTYIFNLVFTQLSFKL